MKKTLLLTAAAFMAITAGAATNPLKPTRPASLHNPQGQTEEMANRLKAQKGVKTFERAERAGASGARRAAKQNVVSPSFDMITDVPAGSVTEWNKSCLGFINYFGYILTSTFAGEYQKMVEAEDGSVYLNMHTCGFPLSDTWVKGSKDADGNIVVPSGQIVYEEDYDGEIISFGMVAMPYEISDGTIYYDYEDEMVFKYDAASGSYTTGEDMLWSLCEWDPYESDWYWTGYGDSGITMQKVTEKLQDAPAGMATEQWSLIDSNSNNGYFVSVGFDNSDVWVKGLFSSNPEAWVKGTIEEESGKVVFAPGQFLGLSDSNTWSYLYGGGYNTIWDEEWEEEVEVVDVQGGFVMNYDPRGQRLISDNCAFSATTRAASAEEYPTLSVMNSIDDFAICLQHRDPTALPTAPYALEFDDYYFEEDGDSDFYFYLSPFDVNGDLLNTENLYYRFYIDGEVFTFYGDEYEGMDEDGQELVNVNFSSWDIYTSGTNHCIYVYATGFESAGIQAVYLQPSEDGGEPTELCSEIVEFDLGDPNAVKTLGGKAAASTYFDLQGRKVNGSGDKGIYIRVDKMADGSVKAVKVAK